MLFNSQSSRGGYLRVSSLLILCLVGCGHRVAENSPNDSKFQREIIGTWTGSNTYEVTLDFDSGGMYREKDIFGADRKETNHAGKWQIADGSLIVTITSSSIPEQEPPGTIHRYKIIHLVTTNLVYSSWDGQQTISFNRNQN